MHTICFLTKIPPGTASDPRGMFVRYAIAAHYRSAMWASSQAAMTSSGQMELCTSPIWAFLRKNMQIRD